LHERPPPIAAPTPNPSPQGEGEPRPPLRIEWRSLRELASCAEQWRELAARTLEPNVFYEPSFALAAAPALGGGVGAGLVWSTSAPARLLGFFPARVEHRRYGTAALPVLVGWTHPYAPLGTPLVDAEGAEVVLRAWLDFVANHAQLPKLMLLPYLPVEGEFAAALDRVMEEKASASFARHERALLVPSGERRDYLARAIGKKKRKELHRQRKRLADSGKVVAVSASWPAEIEAALEDFFALEARGWKGRAGTAARAKSEISGFIRTAVAALAAQGKAQVLRLCLDERAVAALVTLRSGTTAWSWKIAYDEDYARFSPGVQIVLDLTKELLADTHIERADSCAAAGHPMIDHIWRERLALADRLISLAPGKPSRFRLACALEASRRGAFAVAKRMRDLLRR
jgi:CelD/BcsL family acetyltransferase involved in cellulose biosynthesis